MELKYMPVAISLPSGTNAHVNIAEGYSQPFDCIAVIKYFPILDLDDIQRKEHFEAMSECEHVEAYVILDKGLPVIFDASEINLLELPSAAQQLRAPESAASGFQVRVNSKAARR
jgi:hypothetical protein